MPDPKNNDAKVLKKSGEYWSKVTKDVKAQERKSWGHSDVVRQHITKKIYQETDISSPIMALFARYKQVFGKDRFKHAISIGCGNACRELSLMEKGLVEKFDLYEVSDERLKQAKAAAKEKGLSDRINFYLDDAINSLVKEKYDLVFWCHSLHHMLDTTHAVKWSKEALIPGGSFIMYDFVGASRFQWSDSALSYASAVRQLLPDSYLWSLIKPGERVSLNVSRPLEEKLIARDPTEAADSDNILPALRATFDNIEIVPLGGVVYHLALNEIFTNIINDPDSDSFLKTLMLLDDSFSERGLNNFAVAFAMK